MAHKNIILPMAIMGVVVLIIIGGYVVLNNSNDKNNKQNEITENSTNFSQYIENTTKQGMQSFSTFGELKRTADPQFKVGEKYFYYRLEKMPDRENTIFVPREYNTSVEVLKIDRINKTDYYILESQSVSVYSYILQKNEDGVWRKLSSGSPIEYEGCTYGINKESGKIKRVGIPGVCEVLPKMCSEWMLYLDKGVRWIEKFNVSGGQDKSIYTAVTETEWTVTDVEKINGKECFKVVVVTKQESILSNEKKISSELVTYWIDKEKRILVKMEKREDGVLTEMIELRNY